MPANSADVEAKTQKKNAKLCLDKKFNSDASKHRMSAYEHASGGKEEHKGELNFGAYRQGRDPQYLGVNGKNYYAKPWGNDSSNVQAVINGPSYWKRVYYRENVAARFHREDVAAAKREDAAAEASGAASSSGGLNKAASAPALSRLPAEEPADAYAHIKETMKPFVNGQGKPKIRALEHGERLHFFNTLHGKYHMKAGGKGLTWDVSKQTHRSSPNEVNWVLSNYFRTDTQAVLAGAGSDPKYNSSG